METSESSSPGGTQGAPGTGLDGISSVLFFVTEFSASVLLFGMAAQSLKDVTDKLVAVEAIAVFHEADITSAIKISVSTHSFFR